MTDEHTQVPEPPLPHKPWPGQPFRIVVHEPTPLSEVRKIIREKLGLDGHVKVKIGPFALSDGQIVAPVESVDDPCLDGGFQFNLTQIGMGTCVYFGILKPDTPAPEAPAQT